MSDALEYVTVFYDGTCGFCHGAVRFLIRRDPRGEWFRYAPLQGLTAAKVLSNPNDLPDSVVAHLPDGTVHTEGSAAIAIAARIGGAYGVLSRIGALVPLVVLNAAYRFIARHRYRWFGRRTDLCPLMPEHQRALFLP